MQQKQETKRKSNTIETNWKETVSIVRHQVDNGTMKGTIQNIELNGTDANITVKPQGLQKTITCQLDATIRNKQKSEFERFLITNGYEPTEDTALDCMVGQQCQLYVKTNAENQLLFDISVDDLETDDDDQTTRDRIKQNAISLSIGYIIGLLPIINLISLYKRNIEAFKKSKQESKTYDNTDIFFFVGMATSILIIYGIAIPLMYIY
jgi:hypothetical protein